MFGFDPQQWKRAREQVYAVLVERARGSAPINYSALANRISAIRLDMGVQKDRTAFGWLLGDISRETHRNCIGMLSAMAVLKEDNLPALPFFRLARELGYRFADREKFWVEECRRVTEQYRR